ncbi:metalloregulator ArsR/SmtB family transcription factor [Mycoplasmatota bacterium WC44]
MSNLKCDVTHINESVVKEAITNKSNQDILLKTAELFKILGNDTRLKIVDILSNRELCVCDIAVVLNMTQSAISHQLSKLKKHGVVTSRRDGLTIYYSLADNHIEEIYQMAFTHIMNC